MQWLTELTVIQYILLFVLTVCMVVIVKLSAALIKGISEYIYSKKYPSLQRYRGRYDSIL